MRAPLHAFLAIAGLAAFAAPVAGAFEPTLPVPAVDPDTFAAPATPDPDADADATVDAAFGTPAVAGDALDDLRGGTDNKTIVTNVSDVDGKVDGNTAINAVTGGNLVDGGAFGNATGLSTVIQNSGNNVLIQNSTVVSVQFAPTP